VLNRLPIPGSIVIVALLLAIAAPASAQRKGPPTTAQRWAVSLDESSAALVARDYAKALKISERLIREMVEELGPGDAATKFFGIVLSHKAIALAGLGRNDEALWYWQTVISLYPAFAGSDLSTFGAGGAFLDQHRELRVQKTREEMDVENAVPHLTKPRILKRVEPVFPAGAIHFGVQGLMIVSVMIQPDGTLASPLILKALPAPTLTYCALDALRKWRFAPALVEGKPIATQFNLTLNFKLTS
jgi:TonB family protein